MLCCTSSPETDDIRIPATRNLDIFYLNSGIFVGRVEWHLLRSKHLPTSTWTMMEKKATF